MSYSIKIMGFETEDQAIQWCEQYEGGMEQHFELDEGQSVLTDLKKYKKLYQSGFEANEFNEIILPIKIYK